MNINGRKQQNLWEHMYELFYGDVIEADSIVGISYEE